MILKNRAKSVARYFINEQFLENIIPALLICSNFYMCVV